MSEFLSNVDQALKKMRTIFPETPLQKSDYLSKKYNAEVYLKREDLSPVRSYKIRGAFNFIASFLESNPDKNQKFVCASAGNHAQGFAFACAQFGVKGTVFMPITTPTQKVSRTKTIGSDAVVIKLVGDTFDDALHASQKFCEEQKAVFVSPFDSEKIIEGTATIASEILSEFEPDLLFVPIGGGGLSAGISEFLTQKNAKTKIYLCETTGKNTAAQSFAAGTNIEVKKIDTFSDGTAVKKLGDLTWSFLKKNIQPQNIIACPENRVCKTILAFLFHDGIIMEPAGALSSDALKSLPESEIKGKKIVCVVSGGNFDFERLPDVKERAMKFSGTKKYFILRLPQRPGALKEFLNLVGPEDDIARFEYLKKSAKNFGSVLLGIETSNSSNFATLFANMEKAGFEFQDVTEDEILADFVI